MVLTKADAVDSKSLARRVEELREYIDKNTAACNPHVFLTSGRHQLGLTELRTSLYEATR